MAWAGLKNGQKFSILCNAFDPKNEKNLYPNMFYLGSLGGQCYGLGQSSEHKVCA